MTETIITIDGPGCSGKGTLATKLAQELGFFHLDSGLLYRALGYLALHNEPILHTRESFEEKISQLTFSFDNNQLHVFIDGKNIISELRTPSVSRWASIVAQWTYVRELLLPIQHKIGCVAKNIIADGRDMGTVVFPKAQWKFFLVANTEVRALRRWKQLSSIGIEQSLEEVTLELIERDKRDSHREFAPLIPDPDAIIIDTSHEEIENSLKKILNTIRNPQ
jgi:cytidylate kinase